jgi:hypothetical protein
MAGVSLDVRERVIRGFRRRKERASLLSRLSRMRMKKRRRRRWKNRMSASELLRRMLGDFKMEVRAGFLPNYQYKSLDLLETVSTSSPSLAT